MSEMIARLARAIWDSIQTNPTKPSNDSQFMLDNRISAIRGGGEGFAEGHWSAMARAAITALEPTDEMCRAAFLAYHGFAPEVAPDSLGFSAWKPHMQAALRAAWDALLKEGQDES